MNFIKIFENKTDITRVINIDRITEILRNKKVIGISYGMNDSFFLELDSEEDATEAFTYIWHKLADRETKCCDFDWGHLYISHDFNPDV